MKKALLLLLLLALVQLLTAQESKAGFDFTGQVSSLFGKESVTLTFGGPGISFSGSNLEFSARFLPSLRYGFKANFAKPNESMRTVLGFGAQVRYKKLLATLPAFYFFQNHWEFTAGVGVFLPVGGINRKK